MSATEVPAKKQTLTERFQGKTVKSFTGHYDSDFTDPENPRKILQKLEIIFDDGAVFTVSAKEVDMTILVQPMTGPFNLGPEEPFAITAAKLVCE